MGTDDKRSTQLEDVFRRVDVLNNVGRSLSSEQNIHRLLETILAAAKEITNADAGTVYRVDGEFARFEVSGIANSPPPIALYGPDGKPNNSRVVAYAVLNDTTVNVKDAYTEEGFDFSGTKNFDAMTGYRSKSFLTVPMKNHEREIIGVLQLINAKDRQTGEIIPFSSVDQHFAESLASQAAIAWTTRQLINQMEELFESLVLMINTAIDAKSPYTSGHCQRVPELTMMIAEALSEMEEGPLSSFCLGEKDRVELRLAGLLHDCGKIATPVHVMDKATKLETIYDRIHLIATRFEIIKRDARIEYLESVMSEPGSAEIAKQKYARKLMDIENDLAFLRYCNLGSERMSADDVSRVEAIAGKYEFEDAEGDSTSFLSRDEMENLTIRAGTLNDAERKVINNHIELTITMLESLNWPKHFKNVPEYAGGHHERMDGKGYPKGLSKEQMSVQARIMGIADIFEALTASDRPYKKKMTISQAVDIMRKMSDGGHIDPDVFEIFLKKKVHLSYAEKFLDSDQIDEIDIP